MIKIFNLIALILFFIFLQSSFVGITSAALAALYVPKKKPFWAGVRSPKVKTLIKVNGERNDYRL